MVEPLHLVDFKRSEMAADTAHFFEIRVLFDHEIEAPGIVDIRLSDIPGRCTSSPGATINHRLRLEDDLAILRAGFRHVPDIDADLLAYALREDQPSGV